MPIDPLERRRRENIAGYIISMWHLEDLMRAQQLDLRAVEEELVAPMEADEETKAGVRTWYADLIDQMRIQGLEEQGHLAEVRELVDELEFLHQTLLEVVEDERYMALLEAASPDLDTLRRTAQGDPGTIEIGLIAIYGVLVLRAQGKPVTEATAQGEKRIRALLDELSLHYRQIHRLPGVSMN